MMGPGGLDTPRVGWGDGWTAAKLSKDELERIFEHNRRITSEKLLYGGSLQGKRRVSYCFVCCEPFEEREELYHEVCDTWVCPRCGKCFCGLSEDAKRALDAEMFSLGLWLPYANPRRRKRRKGPARRWLEDYWIHNYPGLSWDEFTRRVAAGEIKVPTVPPEYIR